MIPQRAVFEILAKRYVFVVDDKNEVHQREVVIQDELDDIYTISEGIDVTDKIVLEGIRQVREGEHIEYEFEDRSFASFALARGISTCSAQPAD